jgi:hypothetical protein
MASGRLIDYIGYGLIADRPVAPDLHTGTLGLYWATDEDKLYSWDGAWAEVAPEYTPPAETVTFQLAASDLTTPITATVTGAAYFRAPRAFTLTGVRASLLTADSAALITVDIKKNGVTMLTTLITIDATEKTSETAATPAVIDATAGVADIADDDEITADITVAGTEAAGLIVTLIGTAA